MKFKKLTEKQRAKKRLKGIANQKAEKLYNMAFGKIVRMRRTKEGQAELKRLGYTFPNIQIKS